MTSTSEMGAGSFVPNLSLIVIDSGSTAATKSSKEL